jgi:large subunit ribosomal protein L20
MPRAAKGAARTQARQRLLRAARGYRGTARRLKFKAKNALRRAGRFAYRDRRNRKRDMRRLWITRLTAACRMRGARYSLFIHGLQQAGVLLNRKMLSQIAIDDPGTFDRLVAMSRVGSNGEAEVSRGPRRRAAESATSL